MILIFKCAVKAPKNDVLKKISSQIFQNAPIISSIISNFWPITIVILILWVALKAPKNDLLKAILSQIKPHYRSEGPRQGSSGVFFGAF